MNQLSTKEYAISYADASPSELLHNSTEDFICIAMVYFFHVKRTKLRNISQFKKTRGLKRKLQTQKYIIESIESGLIAPMGTSNWNHRIIALKNGKHILKSADIVKEEMDYSENVLIGTEKLSYGHCVSLGWYSVVLASFLKQIGQVAKIENKKNAAIFLDLLPGDNINSLKNFNIVQHIIDNSELVEFQLESIETNKLEKLGVAYGIKDGTTKGIKNDYEYVITDWIVQSFFSLLKYEKNNLDKSSDEYLLSELAKYLINKGVFKISNAIELV
jgi:hypothetical protein